MGTRSDTIIYDDNGREICVMFGMFDGYPDGHGRDLKCFLRGRKLVNGFTDKNTRDFNGMDCMSGSLIAYFKKGVGNFYIHPAGTRSGEYNYHIKKRGEYIEVTMFDSHNDILEEWNSGED